MSYEVIFYVVQCQRNPGGISPDTNHISLPGFLTEELGTFVT